MAASEQQVNRSVTRIGKKLDGIGSKMTSTGRSISAGFTLPLVAVGGAAAVMATRFEDEMGKIRDSAGASQREVQKMTDFVLSMAGSGEFTHGPQELAEALYRVESAGIRGGRAMDVLETASHGAMLGASDLQTTTYALVAALRTGIRGAEDMRTAMGTLTAVVGAGNLRMDDLAGALSTGILPAAKAVGLGLLDVGAAIAVFTSRGIPAQAAATRLRMTFAQMAAPTAKAQKALAEIGIQEGELARRMRGPGGLPGAIRFLQERLMTIPDEAKRTQLVLQAFGGGRTGAAMLILLQNMDDLEKKFGQVGGKAGEFDKLVEEALQGPAENVEKAWASIQASLIQTGMVLLPMIAEIAKEVADASKWFGELSDETKKLIFVFGGIIAIGGPLLILFGTMVSAIAGIVTAVGAIAALGLPFLAIAAAVAVFVAALVAAKVAPDQLAQVLQKLGLSAREAEVVVEGLAMTFDILWTAVELSIRNIKAVVDAGFRVIRGWIDILVGVLTLDFAQAWRGIVAVISSPLKLAKDLIQNWVNAVKSIFSRIWDGMKEQAMRAALAIVEPFSHLPGALGGWARKAKNALIEELGKIEAERVEASTKKLADEYGIRLVPAFEAMGRDARTGFDDGFLSVGPIQFVGTAEQREAAEEAKGPLYVWNQQRQKWMTEAGKVAEDQAKIWAAYNKKFPRNQGMFTPTGTKFRIPKAQARTTPPPRNTRGGGTTPPEPDTNILPADLRLQEAQAEGNLNAQIAVYRKEQEFLRKLLAQRNLSVERKIEITNELNRVNSAMRAAQEELNQEIAEEPWALPARMAEREKVVNATKRLSDDLAFYKREERFLEGLLKNKKLSAAKKAAVRDELRRVRGLIAKLNEDIWEQQHSQPLWTAKMRIRMTRAERTEKLSDDIKVQQDEMRYLKRLLRGLGTTKKDMERRAQIEEEITKVMQKIADLRKQQKEEAEREASERKAMERLFFSERASFFSSFGSSVFRQGAPASAGEQPDRTPGTQKTPGAAFASGGIAPGAGNYDTVPAMLTPGEVVLNKRQIGILAAKLGIRNDPEVLFANAQRFAAGGTVLRPPFGMTREGPHRYSVVGSRGQVAPLRKDISAWLERFHGRGLSRAASRRINDWWESNFSRIRQGYQAGGVVRRPSRALSGGTALRELAMAAPTALAPMAAATGSSGRPVEIHQHFPERTQNLNREAMYAEAAFKSRFDGEDQ